MKLLGWMHRKLKQNSGEPLKDFVIGQQASDEQQYFPRTIFNKPFKKAQRDLNLRKSDEYYEDNESLLSISEIFPGFLAIGTLGSSEPATPKFSISIDHITEREEAEVTENELKLINDELEKVLEAEAKDNDGGSRRNSHELSGKVVLLEGGETNVVCPLQGYLFGSAVELSKTTAMAKKENRTSLGELLQRSKVSDEVGGGKLCEEEDEKQVEKEGDKYGMQLIKKKLKKKMVSAANFKSSLSSTAAAGEDLKVSTKTKLHKIRQLFNRKVYPESTIMGKEKWDHKAQKMNDKKKKTTIVTIDGVNKNNGEERTSTDEDTMIFPKDLILKQSYNNNQSTPPQFSDDDDDDLYWNKEQWIKTGCIM